MAHFLWRFRQVDDMGLITKSELQLRITLQAPPAGVDWALQLGRDELVAPSRAPGGLAFETTVHVVPGMDGTLDFRGAAVQGPRKARFVYLNSGVRAGQTGSRWDRRAKVSLEGLRPLLLAHDPLPRMAAAAIAGTGKDGGPACASVQLLGDGWSVSR